MRNPEATQTQKCHGCGKLVSRECGMHCYQKPGTIYSDGKEVIGVAADGVHVTLGVLPYPLNLDGWVAFDKGTLRYLAANPTPDKW